MKRILIAFGIISSISIGCKKGYLDINQNPNNSTNTTPELVLPVALNNTASRQVVGYPFISGWMGQWGTSGSYAPSNTNFTTYRQTHEFSTSFLITQGGIWTSIYDNLEDYEYVRKTGHDQGKPFIEGVAMVMKSYEFQQLVDMFGNVPYTEALQGTTVITPKYDDQKAIYTDLVDKIDSGIVKMKASGGNGLGSGSDIMFSGSLSSWLKFANSLKLRILMRQTELADRQTYIQSKVAAIVSEGSGFLTTDASVNPGYLNSAGKQNPFWAFNYTVAGGAAQDFYTAGQFGIDFYDANNPASNDPRGRLIYGATSSDNKVFAGNPLGAPAHGGAASSYFGPGVLKSVTQAATIFTAAESYFLQSEAALRGYLAGANAKTLYQSGITASFVYLGSTQAAAATYYNDATNSKAYWNDAASTTAKLNLIIMQKWAAENSITPFETWCDYRRLPDLPFNKSIPLSKSPNVDVAAVPVRLQYPTSEYQTNSANVPAQGANAHHTDKVFWMK